MLIDIVKEIVNRYGEQILFDSKKVRACFSDLAGNEPKPQKQAFIECLEHNAVKILKDVAEPERANCKETIAQRLRTEEGRDVELYREAIDILCEVLFGCVPKSAASDDDSLFEQGSTPKKKSVPRRKSVSKKKAVSQNAQNQNIQQSQQQAIAPPPAQQPLGAPSPQHYQPQYGFQRSGAGMFPVPYQPLQQQQVPAPPPDDDTFEVTSQASAGNSFKMTPPSQRYQHIHLMPTHETSGVVYVAGAVLGGAIGGLLFAYIPAMLTAVLTYVGHNVMGSAIVVGVLSLIVGCLVDEFERVRNGFIGLCVGLVGGAIIALILGKVSSDIPNFIPAIITYAGSHVMVSAIVVGVLSLIVGCLVDEFERVKNGFIGLGVGLIGGAIIALILGAASSIMPPLTVFTIIGVIIGALIGLVMAGAVTS